MRSILIPLAACLMTVGCSSTMPPAAEVPPDAVRSQMLVGEWRVAGIDGEDFDEPYGIALSASDSEIWWNPRCARQSAHYTIDGNRFRWTPPPELPQEPLYVCTIAIPPRLPAIMETIRLAEKIERTPANGIRLSGQGRSLTLFSQ